MSTLLGYVLEGVQYDNWMPEDFLNDLDRDKMWLSLKMWVLKLLVCEQQDRRMPRADENLVIFTRV